MTGGKSYGERLDELIANAPPPTRGDRLLALAMQAGLAPDQIPFAAPASDVVLYQRALARFADLVKQQDA